MKCKDYKVRVQENGVIRILPSEIIIGKLWNLNLDDLKGFEKLNEDSEKSEPMEG